MRERRCRRQRRRLRPERRFTIDGAAGEIIRGEVATIQPEMSGDFATLMAWADEIRTLGVHANADTPEDARTAREFGAEGIGLCRTEHMFFETERIVAMREMILSEDEAGVARHSRSSCRCSGPISRTCSAS